MCKTLKDHVVAVVVIASILTLPLVYEYGLSLIGQLVKWLGIGHVVLIAFGLCMMAFTIFWFFGFIVVCIRALADLLTRPRA